jgi:formylglycine-generating enzyme required for sulfatase activity
MKADPKKIMSRLKAAVTIHLAEGVAMEFRRIPQPPGAEADPEIEAPLSFLMGSRGVDGIEELRHRVVIPQPFYLGTFPVTQEQFAVWTGSQEYQTWLEVNRHLIDGSAEPHRNRFAGRAMHPAESLSWYEARGFVEWLNARKLLPPELNTHVARLPCEAEWEFACRAGTETEYSSGDGEAALEQDGWYGGNSGGTTHPVGEKRKNPWGLHEMHGNVWEWCEDVYDVTGYSKRPDGWLARPWTAADAGKADEGARYRVLRGGSWGSHPEWCRAAIQFGGPPGGRYWDYGFRVFLGLPGPAAEPEKPAGGGGGRERAGGRDDRPGDRKAGAAGRSSNAKRANPGEPQMPI